MIWILFLIGFVIALAWCLYAITTPPVCERCKSRMNYEDYIKDGVEICSAVCPKCGNEIILNKREVA